MKQVFSDTLIEMLENKALNMITITDIVNKCGVSRQSFYYYFNDIYDLIEWYLKKETEKALDDFSNIDSWQIGYIRIMQWSRRHKNLVMNLYHSIQREYIEVFMYRFLYGYIIKVVNRQAEGMQVTEEQCATVAQFYTLAINASSLQWIKEGMKEEPEIVAEKVNFMIEGDFRKALLKFQELNK